ncbi:MAG: SUMF1/EgtB/PvdO family nonheme iron enzyme [bacterium]|nr:SUMF1/EgtB/PvdO family nonheme iron enzyme [bacterium]
MRSRPNNFSLLFFALLILLVWVGCAQQDLYEPPGSPFEEVGRVPLPSENEGVAIIGRYAFVAGGQAGLHSIDFTDPRNPVLLQTLNTLKYSESVEVVRSFVDHQLQDIALVVEGTEGITSYDITDPGNMTSFNSGTTAVFGNRVYVDQPEDPDEPFVAFLAESWKGVRIFESIPAQPGILAYNGVFVGTQGYAEGIEVRNGYAYVADDEMGLAVLDVRILDLDAVSLVSWADTPGEALDVVLEGDYAYVADGKKGLAIFRINEGDTPEPVANLDLTGDCQSVAVRDGLVALAGRWGGTIFVDVSNPSDPIFLGRSLGYSMDLAISSEGFILVADKDNGLIVLQGPGEFTDNTPPSPVRSLTTQSFGIGAVRLNWFATGDDGMMGQASSLDIRYSETPIVDEASWDAATIVTGVPLPDPPGTEMSFVVSELSDGEKHFAIRFSDEVGHISSLSNPVSGIPGEGILLLDGSLDIQGGTTEDTYTYGVTYIFDEAPTVHQVVIDGTAFEMSVAETKIDEIAYTYQTQLPAGSHTYSFNFEVADPEVPPATTEETTGPLIGSLVFTMGSSDTENTLDPNYEPGRQTDEWQHTVVLSNTIESLVSEVTQAQWTSLGFVNPSSFSGANRPVESVTWLQAVQYCNALSADDGLTSAYDIAGETVTWDQEADGWRLPTEAEWEWLCRSGSTTTFAGGPLTGRVCNVDPVLDAMGWYCGSTFADDPSTSDVSQKTANSAGLYDMHGNVWEWCWDWYGDYRVADEDGDGVVLDPTGAHSGTQRVVRGGSWYGGSEDCRSANRESRFTDSADDVVGLRVVRTIFSK